MSVDPSTSIRIRTPSIERASSLVRALVGTFNATDVSLDGDTLEVEVSTHGDIGAAVVNALGVVEEWLAAAGLDSTTVHLSDRTYFVSAALRLAG